MINKSLGLRLKDDAYLEMKILYIFVHMYKPIQFYKIRCKDNTQE